MAVLLKSGPVVRIATCLVAVAVLVTCLAMIAPRGVSAGAGPSIIHGTVTDSAGRPIASASVVVVMMNGLTQVDTASTTTGSDGIYVVTFAIDKWSEGFEVTSTATFNSVQVSDTAGVDQFGMATINLQFPFEIPQFGSLLGFAAAAGLVGVVAAVFLIRKSK